MVVASSTALTVARTVSWVPAGWRSRIARETDSVTSGAVPASCAGSRSSFRRVGGDPRSGGAAGPGRADPRRSASVARRRASEAARRRSGAGDSRRRAPPHRSWARAERRDPVLPWARACRGSCVPAMRVPRDRPDGNRLHARSRRGETVPRFTVSVVNAGLVCAECGIGMHCTLHRAPSVTPARPSRTWRDETGRIACGRAIASG